jgi:hypothetical protein
MAQSDRLSRGDPWNSPITTWRVEGARTRGSEVMFDISLRIPRSAAISLFSNCFLEGDS